jgi:hypothetical protein
MDKYQDQWEAEARAHSAHRQPLYDHDYVEYNGATADDMDAEGHYFTSEHGTDFRSPHMDKDMETWEAEAKAHSTHRQPLYDHDYSEFNNGQQADYVAYNPHRYIHHADRDYYHTTTFPETTE